MRGAVSKRALYPRAGAGLRVFRHHEAHSTQPHTGTRLNIRAVLANDRIRGWALLAALQAAVSVALFHDYLSGEKYFAFADVGSDTWAQFVPALIHLASPANWSSAWSFNAGLGGILPFVPGPFTLLSIAGGPDHVLDLRIWAYLAKILVGGAAFYGFALAIGTRREAALVVALAYSFCGYATTDGQWDPSASDFATYAVILWAIARHAVRPNAWLIPLSIAFAACSGAFMFSAGVFVAYLFIAACVASDRPWETARTWCATVLPQCLVGLLLAAPVVLPSVVHLLDSPRITGAQSRFGTQFGGLFSFNDQLTILVELSGFFHKNMLDLGSRHMGWMNYLESPGFYVGTLALLAIPQLWRGTGADRRILRAGAIAIALFIFVPAVRYAAFGFGLDYFRINNLWVSMLLLALFARSLGVIASRGVDARVLVATLAGIGAVIYVLQNGLFPPPLPSHQLRLAAFALAGVALFGLLAAKRVGWPRFATCALALTALELAVVNYPSFHAHRAVVTRQTPGYHNDGTNGALDFIKARDPGVHRIEKTYNSVSFCDALAQGYMGVKSYWFQSSGVVGYYADLELIPRQSRLKNHTNWLPNFGSRFVLNTLAGVKYVIAHEPLDWPGFRRIHASGRLSIYENDMALPLGVVHTQQLPKDRIGQLSAQARDIAMVNAAIVDRPRGESPHIFDPGRMAKPGPGWLEENYFAPAQALRSRGLAIDRFSPGYLSGRVTTDRPGVLVLSIPFTKGWSVAVDGVDQPVYSAQLGMLATDIGAGTHRVEARYALPGLAAGLWLALAGAIAGGVLAALWRVPGTPAPKGGMA